MAESLGEYQKSFLNKRTIRAVMSSLERVEAMVKEGRESSRKLVPVQVRP